MEDIRGIQHPLQTPLVLECIFKSKSLGVSDLMACRQVCGAWHEEATPVVRPLTKVIIQGDKEGRGVADFLELVQSEASTFSESPFVTKFQITHLTYSEKDRAFWEFCGRSIKSLHLSNASFPTDNEFGHALFQSCPNLEKLYLEDVDVSPEGNSDDQPVVWAPPRFPHNRNLKSLDLKNNRINGLARMEILSHFPCLEKLNLEVLEDSEANGDWVFRSLTILRERDHQGWPLRILRLDLTSLKEPLAILPVLVQENLALEVFAATGIVKADHGIVLRGILEAHANSLKKLTLGSSWVAEMDDAIAEISDMRLEKLEFLSLNGVDLSTTNVLRNLPNLKRIEIHNARSAPEDPNDDWILTNCTESYLRDQEPGDLQNLLRRLPNLEKLTLGWCDNELFAMICDFCPKLTYLSLSECDVDDCGISGLDVDDVERIYQERANGWTWWRPITVARPNLSSLKNLKWFRFWVKRISLGYCAAVCGVQQLPNLQHLCLEPLNEFAETVWKPLTDQFPWVDQ